MDAPLAEELIRLILAIAVTAGFGTFLVLARLLRRQPEWWIVLYLTIVIGLYAGWRWFIFWLGLVPGESGFDEPTIRSIGNVLLIFFFVAVFLIALFRVRRIRESRADEH